MTEIDEAFLEIRKANGPGRTEFLFCRKRSLACDMLDQIGVVVVPPDHGTDMSEGHVFMSGGKPYRMMIDETITGRKVYYIDHPNAVTARARLG